MVTIGKIYDFIDRFAPFDTQMSFDNAGLLVGGREESVERVLVALDVTRAVAEEARERGCGLIVSHHPVIFTPLRSIKPGDVVYRLISNKTAVIAAHTNYDVAADGVNYALASALGLENIRTMKRYLTRYGYKVAVFVPKDSADAVAEAMARAGAGALGNYTDCAFLTEGKGQFRPREGARPAVGEIGALERVDEVRVEMICGEENLSAAVAAMKEAHPYEEPAYDIFENRGIEKICPASLCGELPEALSPRELAVWVKKALGCSHVKLHSGEKEIRTVGVCGGAGSEMLFEAIGKTDAYLSSEVKHHEWLAAREAGFTLIDAGHFPTEDIAVEPLRRRLSEAFPEIEFVKSAVHTDPVSYV